jgi:hypothetical protein
MNTIARASAALLLALGAQAAQPAAAQPFPRGGDCRAYAGQSHWRGEFAGATVDLFDRRRLVSARACFPDRYTCNRWINEMMTATDDTDYMRCVVVGG